MSGLFGNIVVPYPPTCPSTATEVNIYADNPLELSNANSPHTAEYVIGNGKTFKLQRMMIGAGHDPSEKGTMVEVIYKDASEHVVSRYFADNVTYDHRYADVAKARDGTSMVGDGSAKKILVRRTRLSSASQMVDVHLQGYEE